MVTPGSMQSLCFNIPWLVLAPGQGPTKLRQPGLWECAAGVPYTDLFLMVCFGLIYKRKQSLFLVFSRNCLESIRDDLGADMTTAHTAWHRMSSALLLQVLQALPLWFPHLPHFFADSRFLHTVLFEFHPSFPKYPPKSLDCLFS